MLPKTINDFVLVNGDSLLDINLDDLKLMCKKKYLGVITLVPNKNYIKQLRRVVIWPSTMDELAL